MRLILQLGSALSSAYGSDLAGIVLRCLRTNRRTVVACMLLCNSESHIFDGGSACSFDHWTDLCDCSAYRAGRSDWLVALLVSATVSAGFDCHVRLSCRRHATVWSVIFMRFLDRVVVCQQSSSMYVCVLDWILFEACAARSPCW